MNLDRLVLIALTQEVQEMATRQTRIEATVNEIRELLVSAHESMAADVCEHPDEARIDLSSFGDLDHWVCGVCRYDNKVPTMN